MPFCPNCGSEVGNDAYCANCGAPQGLKARGYPQNSSDPGYQQPQKVYVSTRYKYDEGICLLLCCCLSPVAALIYYLLTDHPENDIGQQY